MEIIFPSPNPGGDEYRRADHEVSLVCTVVRVMVYHSVALTGGCSPVARHRRRPGEDVSVWTRLSGDWESGACGWYPE